MALQLSKLSAGSAAAAPVAELPEPHSDGLPRPEPVTITFRDIRFTVKDRMSGQPLQILKGVSGKVGDNLPGTAGCTVRHRCACLQALPLRGTCVTAGVPLAANRLRRCPACTRAPAAPLPNRWHPTG